MDLLTDLLQQAGVRRRLLDLHRLDAARSLRFPCDRSIGLHVVVQGRVHLHAPSLDAPLALAAGDIAVMARGQDHVLSLEPALRKATVRTIEPWPQQRAEALPVAEGGSAVISGAYQLWNAPLHPFFAELPAWFVLRADELPRLGPLALSLGLLQAEVTQREMGADTVVHALLDVIFTYLLREIVARSDPQQAGWRHAVADPLVRQAVALMHGDCARAWTLEELAAGAGLSRTALAERFRQAMGDTPMNYLRTVRLQRALRLLSETPMNLEQVALEVGYQDAFSFSKVFKRVVGESPRDFRRRDEEDKRSPWRFQAG